MWYALNLCKLKDRVNRGTLAQGNIMDKLLLVHCFCFKQRRISHQPAAQNEENIFGKFHLEIISFLPDPSNDQRHFLIRQTQICLVASTQFLSLLWTMIIFSVQQRNSLY